MIYEGIIRDIWDLVTRVVSTSVGVINFVISIVTLLITLVTKSHDPLSKA